MLRRSLQAVLALGLITVSMSVGAWAVQANDPPPEAKAHYARARRYLARNDEDSAIEDLKNAIRLAPEFVEAHQLYLDRQRVSAKNLVGEYDARVKENPTSAVFRYLLGKAHASANFDRPEMAEAEYQKAVEMDPKFGWAWLELSRLTSRRGDRAKANDCLEKARKFAGDNLELRLAVASALNRAKQFKSALKEAESILTLDPNYFEAHLLKWQAKLNLKNGSQKARAEVVKEIQALEAKHTQHLDALVVVHKGYTTLDDDEGKERAKKAITALAPKFFDVRFSTVTMTMDGKTIRVPGEIMRRQSDTFRIRDPKERLEALRQLEKEIEDEEVKHFLLYPSIFSVHLAQDDLENAEQLLDTMKTAGMGLSRLAQQQVYLAQAYWRRRNKLDRALDLVQEAVEGLRQSLAQPSGDARSSDRLREQLTEARGFHAQLLMEQRLIGKDVRARVEATRQLQRDRLETYLQLEKEVTDATLKRNIIFPRIFQDYLTVENLEGAERMLETMKTAGVEPSRLAEHEVNLARSYVRKKLKLDRAHELAQGAIEKLRQALTEMEAAGDINARFTKPALANGLYVQHQILTEKGLPGQSLDSLVESVKAEEQEANTLDLGLAYSNAGRVAEAIEMLTKAYGFEGGMKGRAKAAIEAIYGEREKTNPLAALLAEAVEARKKQREEMMASMRALRGVSIGRAEPVEPKPAPDFELATLNGKKLRLSDLRGKVVVLNFWATW
jgi:tetratricopeptide (TPR) repeat protein